MAIKKDSAFWKRMKKELLDKFQTSTEQTHFEVEFYKGVKDEISGLDIYPGSKTGGTFYAFEIYKFCDYNGLSAWADVATHKGGLCVHVHIY